MNWDSVICFFFYLNVVGGWHILIEDVCVSSIWIDEVTQLPQLVFAVADMLLWRDKKQTLTALLVLVVGYYNFIASGFTLLSALSKLLLSTTIFLFIHGILPEKMYVWLLFSWTCHCPG